MPVTVDLPLCPRTPIGSAAGVEQLGEQLGPPHQPRACPACCDHVRDRLLHGGGGDHDLVG
jgi:hypothetical protein